MSYKVIGHRGYSAVHPENTFSSIRAAIEETSASGIEIDIHLTSDCQLVIQHDADLDRMTDGTGKISDLPYFGYIENLKTRGTGEPVALLFPVLEYLTKKDRPIILVLDVKDDQPLQVLDELKDVLARVSREGNLCIYLGVWREDFAIHARELFGEGGVLFNTLIAEKCTVELIRSPLYDAFNLDVDGVTSEIVQEAAALKKDLLLWTCNTPEQVSKAKAFNAQAILTDDPTIIESAQ